MSRKGRMLVLFSGKKDDFNRVVKIAMMNPVEDIELLHISGFNAHSAPDFPRDVVFDLYRNARNIVGCYICDGTELANYLRKICRSTEYMGQCLRCQLTLNLVNVFFIKKEGYDQMVCVSPQFDCRLYQIPAESILDDPKYFGWNYPVTDYGIASEEVSQRCIFDSCIEINPDITMSEESMISFCHDLIDSGILEKLTFEEAYLLPF